MSNSREASFFVLVRDGGKEPAIKQVAVAGTEIGRERGLHCVLKDNTVSRVAARIVEERGVLCLENTGRRNPARVRGGRTLALGEREPLRHGLIIEIGLSTIEIEEQISARSSAPSEKDTIRAAGHVDGSSSEACERTAPAVGHEVRGDIHATPVAPIAGVNPREPAPSPQVPRQASAPPLPDPALRKTERVRPRPEDPAALGTMLPHGARLVIANDADLRIVRLEGPVTRIGFAKGECRLPHPTVSELHAEIHFVAETNFFQIVDEGSTNHTYVGGVQLAPGVSQPLTPECLVVFGTIEAIFVVDLDRENKRIPSAQFEAAVRLLISELLITDEQARAARREASNGTRHVGEALILSSGLSARAWSSAFERARFVMAKEALDKVGRRSWYPFIVIVAVLLALGLGWLFRAQLGFVTE